ncbi:DEAD/DEAH box helicase family protein [Streptomyces murinus]|uniref:hypothetical protein n=1 Tax=Streptomyces murinus TaxID=33900 RepID=UPI003729A0C8
MHELRLEAGLPSARDIRNLIGRDAKDYWIVNHQAVLNTFQNPDLPPWGRLERIVVVLFEVAGCSDAESEAERFKNLWKQAFDEMLAQTSAQPPAEPTVSEDAATRVDAAEQPKGQSEEDAGDGTVPIDYAQESLKGLIINAAQALWDDKDALNVFLGVVRRSEGFVKLADATAERRPANATFYGVKSAEFEVGLSPARLELVNLHNLLNKHRTARHWSFTYLGEKTGISSGEWIRWYTHGELPHREAVVAFSHMAHLPFEDHVLLFGLWDAAHEALEAQRRFDALPPRVSFDEAWLMRAPVTPRLWTLVGIGGEDQRAYGPDLATGTAPAFVVTGPSRSGRSTALVGIARALLAAETRLVLAAPAASPLRELGGLDGVLALFDGPDIPHDDLEEALSSASPEEPVVVVVDDAEILEDCAAGSLLMSMVQHGFEEGTAVIVSCQEGKFPTALSWLVETRKAHRGLLLSPQDGSTGAAIGIRTGNSIVGWPITPGRGWLHLGDGKLLAVAVPG